jgi:hypothetical protein
MAGAPFSIFRFLDEIPENTAPFAIRDVEFFDDER